MIHTRSMADQLDTYGIRVNRRPCGLHTLLEFSVL